MLRKMGLLLSLLSTASFLLSCAATLKTMYDPIDDRNFLVIGSILLENFYLNDQLEVYRGNIEVAVLGRIDENGKIKMTGHWVKTDRNGYFFLADVPPGEYALKGVRTTLSHGYDVSIVSSLQDANSEYHLGWKSGGGTTPIIFKGDYFFHKPRRRVINLEHNCFRIERSMELRYEHPDSATDLELITGQKIHLPPVQEYFIEKYPTSEWLPLLKESLINK